MIYVCKYSPHHLFTSQALLDAHLLNCDKYIQTPPNYTTNTQHVYQNITIQSGNTSIHCYSTPPLPMKLLIIEQMQCTFVDEFMAISDKHQISHNIISGIDIQSFEGDQFFGNSKCHLVLNTPSGSDDLWFLIENSNNKMRKVVSSPYTIIKIAKNALMILPTSTIKEHIYTSKNVNALPIFEMIIQNALSNKCSHKRLTYDSIRYNGGQQERKIDNKVRMIEKLEKRKQISVERIELKSKSMSNEVGYKCKAEHVRCIGSQLAELHKIIIAKLKKVDKEFDEDISKLVKTTI